MKTAIKIAALAMIAVLCVLSCTQEVKLTGQDWAATNKGIDPELYDFSTPGFAQPYFDWDGANAVTFGTEDPLDREFYFYVPLKADFVKAFANQSENEINNYYTAELKKFLNFYTFTHDSGEPYNTSVLGTGINYTVSKTVYSGIRVEFTIRFTTNFDPEPSPPTFPMVVAKIDGTKYSFGNGKKLDMNNDNISGESPYDDMYQTLSVSGASTTTFVPPGGDNNWHFQLGLNHDLTYLTDDPSANERTFEVASFWGFGIDYFVDEDTRDAVIATLISKLKLQKFDISTDTWVNASGAVFEQEASAPNFIEMTFTPQDTVAYRVVASGMENLTLGNHFGAVQKVFVNSNSTYGDAFNRDFITSEVQVWRNNTDFINRTAAQTPLVGANSYYTSNSEGKEVVLHLKVNSIDDTNGDPFYLPAAAPSLEQFNKNFKIVFSSNIGAATSISNVLGFNNLQFIDIVDVKYNTNRYTDMALDPLPKDEITLTLDPNYLLNTGGTKYLLLAPGFKYASNEIRFGNYEYLSPFDGTHYFENYRAIPLSF